MTVSLVADSSSLHGTSILGLTASSVAKGQITTSGIARYAPDAYVIQPDNVTLFDSNGNIKVDENEIGPIGQNFSLKRISPTEFTWKFYGGELDPGNTAIVKVNAYIDGLIVPIEVDMVRKSSGLSISFDQTASFNTAGSPIITGSIANFTGSGWVTLYDDGNPIGTTHVATDGSWRCVVSRNTGSGTAQDHSSLTAEVVDGTGNVAQATAPFTLRTDVTGESYSEQESDHSADGTLTTVTNFAQDGTTVSQTLYNADGTHFIYALVNGQTLTSVHDDVLTGGGSSERFFFVPKFGRDEVTDFALSGPEHDVLDLSATRLSTLVAVLHDTTMHDGNAVIRFNNGDRLQLDGITQAMLKAHPADIAFG